MDNKIKYIAAVFAVALPISSFAALEDYVLRRLPASIGNEFLNPAGNLRQFVPTSVNDSGLLSGFRLTHVPENDGGNAGVVGEVSYIYDLKSRSYLAKVVNDISIVFIGDDNYIGKRLTRDGSNRWQTLRCPISGLVQNQNDTWDNPGCQLIDNDLIDDFTVLENFGFRSELYQFANITTLPTFIGNVATGQGSVFVADIPDQQDTHPNGDEASFYFSDGASYKFVINNAPVNSLTDGAYRLVQSGSDVKLLSAKFDGSSQANPAVYRTYIVSSSGFELESETYAGTTDSTGYVATPLAVSVQGGVINTAGYCADFDSCSSPSIGIDMWAEFSSINFTGSSGSAPDITGSFLGSNGMYSVLGCEQGEQAPCVKSIDIR